MRAAGEYSPGMPRFVLSVASLRGRAMSDGRLAMSQENNKSPRQNMPTREELLKQGQKLFDKLSARDSGVRGFSEALRTNSADDYDRNATANAFEHGLDEDVERIGQIADRFSKVKEPD
jgi:hypothetical protein